MQEQYGLIVPEYDLPAQRLERCRLAVNDDRQRTVIAIAIGRRGRT